ncbi:MAG: hypothetical protein JJ881_20355 [Alphaproteobacteria bacterium]|jgi:hypothetical protein|nr:hypothetical protein [Alphaproteobacteria bacterium]
MEALKPILLALAGVLVILGFAATLWFGVEAVLWIALILVPVVFVQTLLWGK